MPPTCSFQYRWKAKCIRYSICQPTWSGISRWCHTNTVPPCVRNDLNEPWSIRNFGWSQAPTWIAKVTHPPWKKLFLDNNFSWQHLFLTTSFIKEIVIPDSHKSLTQMTTKAHETFSLSAVVWSAKRSCESRIMIVTKHTSRYFCQCLCFYPNIERSSLQRDR